MTKKTQFFSKLFCLICLLGCVGCEQPRQELVKFNDKKGPYNPMVRIADSMNQASDFHTAIKLYRQSLDMNPNDIDARLGLARALAALGYHEKAIQNLEIILASKPHVEALQELGKIYLVSNNPKKCISAYQDVLKAIPGNVAAMNGIGVCSDIEGKHQLAQQWYEKALNINPDHLGVKSNLGLSQVLAGNLEQGINILEKVVDTDPTERNRQNLAIAYGLFGDYQTAAQLFSADLDSSAVRNNLAIFHHINKAQPAPQMLAQNEAKEEQIASPAPAAEEEVVQISPIQTEQDTIQISEVAPAAPVY